MLIQVPLSLSAGRLRPRGWRLPPRPPQWVRPQPPKVEVLRPTSPWVTSRKPSEAPSPTLLPPDAYRFWIGSRHTTTAWCRACAAYTSTFAQRLQHMEEKKCTTTLVAAYKLLLRDPVCVVCDKPTLTKHYGVPMCVSCREPWQFDWHSMPKIREAIRLLGGKP